MQELQGKVAFVTGAAGGIGKDIVKELVRAGVKVAAVDREESSLSKLRDIGEGVQVYPLDITNEQAIESIVSLVEEGLGPIDMLVNVAGMLHLDKVETMKKSDWDETFAVNSTGVFLVSRVVSQKMIHRKSGSIVTVSSNAARMPRVSMAAYAASKAAATQFTKCLGLELASHNIRCNVVSPGSTETEMLKQLWKDESGAEVTIAGTMEDYKVGIPLQKLGQPQDVSGMILFLLSERSSHITMQDICVDGGATLGV